MQSDNFAKEKISQKTCISSFLARKKVSQFLEPINNNKHIIEITLGFTKPKDKIYTNIFPNKVSDR